VLAARQCSGAQQQPLGGGGRRRAGAHGEGGSTARRMYTCVALPFLLCLRAVAFVPLFAAAAADGAVRVRGQRRREEERGGSDTSRSWCCCTMGISRSAYIFSCLSSSIFALVLQAASSVATDEWQVERVGAAQSDGESHRQSRHHHACGPPRQQHSTP